MIKKIFLILMFLPLVACSKQRFSLEKGADDFSSLSFDEKTEFKYAEILQIKNSGEYKLVEINSAGKSSAEKYLIVPAEKKIPQNVPQGVTILKKPLNKTYLLSTSQMDFISRLGALDMIRLTGTKEKDWYIEEAVEAIKNKKIIYGGKYSSPDYELLLAEGCNLALENTMVLHKPEVKEKLEALGIPVLIEKSGYEKNPLGRLEWIKLYGALFDKEAEAEEFMKAELKKIEPVLNQKNTGKTVAFFFVTSSGSVNVRKPDDYISRMIELSGGKYILPKNEESEGNALSTMNMQLEDFYAAAVNADIIIYNSTIDGKLESLEKLLQKSRLFADFKAVKDGRAYCTEKNFFQETTGMADFMKDINKILNDENNEEDLKYLEKLN